MNKLYSSLILFLLFFVANSQSLVSVNSASANAGQTLSVTITGTHTHFTQTSGTTFTGVNFGFTQTSGTTVVNSTSVVNDSVIVSNITVPSSIVTGSYNVFTNGVDGLLSLVNGFYVNGTTSSSAGLTAITPSVVSIGQTLNVTVTGTHTHFLSATTNTLAFSFTQVSGTTVVNSQTVVNDSTIQSNITIPSNVITGNYHVFLNNNIDGLISLNNGVHVNGINAPHIASINSAGAQVGQTLNVTVTGVNTHFNQASNTLNFTFSQTSSTTPPVINTVNTVNDTSMVLNITVPPTALNGLYYFNLSNSLDGSLSENFYVFTNCFSHFTTSYNQPNNQFTLMLDSITTASAISYSWDFGDGAISTAQAPNHIFANNATYLVCLKIKTTVIDSCTYSHQIGFDLLGNIVLKQTSGFSLNVSPYLGITTGVEVKNYNEKPIILFPNPTNGAVNVFIEDSQKLSNAMITLLSIDGKTIEQKPCLTESITFNVNELATGVYFIKLTSKEKNEVIKFIK